ncbi:MAG: DUF4405 domain-containing protein [Atopobiaceae bacterium]|nr:DUF4405 domain-containing protein [Atopobiaceae bacterium]
MNRQRATRIAVDVAMSVVLVATMSTALVQEAPHEYLGIATFVLMTAHIVLNRKWLAAMLRGRGRFGALRIVQAATMLLLVACVVGQVVSSVILSKHALGFLPAIPGASWARRVHMACAYWTFVFAFVHAGLHIRVPRRVDGRKLLAPRVVLAIVSAYGVWSFVKLGLLPYLLFQVQFAFADFSTPVALITLRYASVAVFLAVIGHILSDRLR